MKALAAAMVSCVLLAACDQSADGLGEERIPAEPGKKLIRLPAKVWEREKCGTRALPYLRLDHAGIAPKTAKPGESINYRFTYTACVPKQPGYVLGWFRTDISHEGENVSTRKDNDYPVETGKLVVDTHIVVPKNAAPGTYTLNAELSVRNTTIRDTASFNVAP